MPLLIVLPENLNFPNLKCRPQNISLFASIALKADPEQTDKWKEFLLSFPEVSVSSYK